jgi:hypothetical protein
MAYFDTWDIRCLAAVRPEASRASRRSLERKRGRLGCGRALCIVRRRRAGTKGTTTRRCVAGPVAILPPSAGRTASLPPLLRTMPCFVPWGPRLPAPNPPLMNPGLRSSFSCDSQFCHNEIPCQLNFSFGLVAPHRRAQPQDVQAADARIPRMPGMPGACGTVGLSRMHACESIPAPFAHTPGFEMSETLPVIASKVFSPEG